MQSCAEVLNLFSLNVALFLVFLHLKLLHADLDLRVVLDGAAGLDEKDVDTPVLHVISGHDGADVGVQMKVPGSVGVQDGGEPGPVAVEEIFGRDVVVGAPVLEAGLEAIAVAEDLFGG